MPLTTEEHRKLGAKYGYPPCCIDFFVTDWQAAPASLRDAYLWLTHIWQPELEHVPCWECLRGPVERS